MSGFFMSPACHVLIKLTTEDFFVFCILLIFIDLKLHTFFNKHT